MIVTLERDYRHTEVALESLWATGVEDVEDLRCGDTRELLGET